MRLWFCLLVTQTTVLGHKGVLWDCTLTEAHKRKHTEIYIGNASFKY